MPGKVFDEGRKKRRRKGGGRDGGILTFLPENETRPCSIGWMDWMDLFFSPRNPRKKEEYSGVFALHIDRSLLKSQIILNRKLKNKNNNEINRGPPAPRMGRPNRARGEPLGGSRSCVLGRAGPNRTSHVPPIAGIS